MKAKWATALILGLVPGLGLCYDAQIESLIKTKQQKVARLEKCSGSTKGLKIAGISTLGLTAVGVGVNIAEATKIKSNETTITNNKNKISELNKEIEKLEAAKNSVGANVPMIETYGYKEIDSAKELNSDLYKLGAGEWYGEWGKTELTGVAKCSAKDGNNDNLNFKNNKNEWLAKNDELSADGDNCWCAKKGTDSYVFLKKKDGCKSDCAGSCITTMREHLKTEAVFKVFTDLIAKASTTVTLDSVDLAMSVNWDEDHCRWKPLREDGWKMTTSFRTDNSNGLTNGEWEILFAYGTVRGMSMCSGRSGDNHVWGWGGNRSDWLANKSALDSASGEKKYCWCNVTHFTPTNDREQVLPNSSSVWVFCVDDDSASICESDCARNCANSVQDEFVFRRALFRGE